MERKRIVINFKNTAEDEALYNELQKYSCKSAYIKDVLRGVLSISNQATKAPIKEAEKVDEDIFDGIDDILG